MGVTNSKNIQFQDPSIHTKQFSQPEDGDSAFLRNVKGKGFPLRAKRVQKGSRAIAQAILDQGARRDGWSAPCTGRFNSGDPVGLRAGLYGKSHPHLASKPGPSIPYRAAYEMSEHSITTRCRNLKYDFHPTIFLCV
jgi:hypothetical protein